MKRFKKMMAIAIACAMIVGTVSFGTLGAFGADAQAPSSDSYNHPIKITGLTKGDKVTFYKVVEWVGDTSTETPPNTDVSGWRATEAFNSVLTPAELKKMLVENNSTTPPSSATGMTAELAGKLASVTLPTSPKWEVTVGDDKTASLDTAGNGAGPGLYMAIITPADANTVYNPVFVSANYGDPEAFTFGIPTSASYDDSAAAKKSTVKVDKTASTEEDAWDEKDSKGGTTPNTNAIGDTVTYTVKTTIPGYGTIYDNPHFVLKDTLTDLKLVENDITVKAGDSALTKGEDKDYTIETSETGYTITFTTKYLKGLAAPQEITVVYKALVQEGANKNVDEKDNQVQIEYSHDPTNETDYDIKKDTTQHYTFTIDADALGFGSSASGKKGSEIVKVAVDAKGNPIFESKETASVIETSHVQKSPLAGAEFKLYTNEACTDEYTPKNEDGTAGTKLNIVSGTDGRLGIKAGENFTAGIPGLDAGTYYLKETKAPAGYVKDANAYKIDINATVTQTEITEYFYNNTWYKTEAEAKAAAGSGNESKVKSVTYKTDVLQKYTVKVNGKDVAEHWFENPKNSTDVNWVIESAKELPASIVNTKGVELPSTGGMGTTLFYIIGAILIIGAGVLLVTRRRTESAE